MPYMILAFVNDPIQTAFLYMIGASFILCICLLIYSVCSLCVIMGKVNIVTVMRKQYGSISYICFTLASGFSIAYFLTILIFILTLGNFHDFQAVENLTLPIVIGLLSMYLCV